MVFASIAIRVVLPPEAILRLRHEGTETPRCELDLCSPSFEEGKALFQLLSRKKSDALSLLEEYQLAPLAEAELLPD